MTQTGHTDRIGLGTRPRFAAHTRLSYDRMRRCHVLLTPERVGFPDLQAVEILDLCTGDLTVAQIAEALSERYAADPASIAHDVIALLSPLLDARHVESRHR